jgi:uncharacterized membrane protein
VEAQRQSRLLVLALGLLSILGIGLAGYMSYTDLLGSVPVCGGVGDCETVHTSAYAYLATVPVAVLGLLSYMGITALALVRWRAKGTLGYLASLGILVLASSGTLFSAYLTYVEFFVIDAVCPWCVASAVTITVSLALAATDVAAQTRRG